MQETYTTYGTKGVNDQLVPVYEREGLYAPKFALQSTVVGAGRGSGLSLPGGGRDYSGGGTVGSGNMMGGGSSGPANLDASDEAANDPFSPEKSPVLWACVFLIVGLLGLRYVHWRG